MNKLKPEDVYKWLDEIANNENLKQCSGIPSTAEAALALLHEKDARIEELEAENREVHSNWQKLKETLDAVTEEDKRILAEKDAEIEWLRKLYES